MAIASSSNRRSNVRKLDQSSRRRAGRLAIGYAIESLETRLLFSTLTVNTLADNVTSDNFLSLREAVALIESGGDANAALGRSLTADEQAQIDTTNAFGTNDTMVFDGSIAGGTVDLTSQLNITSAMTIEGGASGITLSGGASATWRAFNVTSSGNLTVDHLTISNFSVAGNYDPDNGGNAEGGAIYNNSGIVDITNCTLESNSVTGGGSGVNGGFGSGGAIYNISGTVTISDSTLSDNQSTGGSGGVNGYAGSGGAIYNTANNIGPGQTGPAGTVAITNSTLSDNNATGGSGGTNSGGGAGGGIYTDSGTVTLTDDTLSGNGTTGGTAGINVGGANGGAIYNDSASVSINTSTLDGNTSTGISSGYYGGSGDGGAIYSIEENGPFSSGSAVLNITDSTLTQNSATSGSGPYASGQSDGGAIYQIDGSSTINFATISGNSAGSGRGLYLSDDGMGGTVSATIANSILGQTDNSVADLVVNDLFSSPTLTGSNNLIRNTSVTGIGNISSADPLLEPLANNGGPTETMALQAASPAVDAAGATEIATDQRGDPRVFNSVADIGAYERQGPDITNADDATFTAGSAGTFTFATIGTGTTALAETGSLPSGVTFVDNGNGTATLSGTPATGSGDTYPLVITASNAQSTSATQSFTLTVASSPSFGNANHATFNAGVAGTFTISTTSFPVAALSETGSLPAGITFVDNENGTATLSGTPTGAGAAYPLTLRADNVDTAAVTQSFTLTVDAAPGITSTNHATFKSGTAGTFTISTVGFPAPALGKSGSLPPGLTFVDNQNGTATLSGTPSAGTGGTYPVTITAGNVTQSFTLTVDSAPSITSANQVTFTTGTAGTFTVSTSGFPMAALNETGSLPSGVTFVDNGNGTATLSGTPATGTADAYSLTIAAANGVTPAASQSFALTVVAADTQPSAIATSSTIQIDNPDGTTRFTINNPFPHSEGAPRVSVTNAVGSAVPYVIVGAAPGGKAMVAVYNGNTGVLSTEFQAFPTGFTGGVFVAGGDVNHDGVTDFVVGRGAQAGGPGTIKIFNGVNNSLLASFTAFSSSTGVRVAVADVNGDGYADVIATQGPTTSGATQVRVYSGKALAGGVATLLSSFTPFAGFDGGAFVAAGDIKDTGQADIIVAKLQNAHATISVFNGSSDALIDTFSTPSSANPMIAAHDYNDDGFDDIFVPVTVNGVSSIKIFSGKDNSLLGTIAASSGVVVGQGHHKH